MGIGFGRDAGMFSVGELAASSGRASASSVLVGIWNILGVGRVGIWESVG